MGELAAAAAEKKKDVYVHFMVHVPPILVPRIFEQMSADAAVIDREIC